MQIKKPRKLEQIKTSDKETKANIRVYYMFALWILAGDSKYLLDPLCINLRNNSMDYFCKCTKKNSEK